MDSSKPGFPIHHPLLELAQTHVHWVDDSHPTISSSVVHFSSGLQSFSASGSFPISQFFALGGQSIGASTSASVLPMNIQCWFPLRLTGLTSVLIFFTINWFNLLAVQKIPKTLLQHHSSKASVLWCSTFFMIQLSHPTWLLEKTIALTRWTLLAK